MDSLVVYYSLFGNTRRVAETIAGTLARAGRAGATSLDQLEPGDLDRVDLLVMGSPTHYQNLPKEVRAVLETLPTKCLAGKGVAAFDTSVETWGPLMHFTASHRLLRRLRKMGGEAAAKAETFLVEQSEVRDQGEIDLLREGELERARKWAAAVLTGAQA